MNKSAFVTGVVLATLSSSVASATDYEFCISSDRRQGRVLVKSGPADFGKEWYKVKAAQAYCTVYGANGCSAQDYTDVRCGMYTSEELKYYSVSGDQVKALFSGNPALMAQTGVEIIVGAPVKAVGDAANTVGSALHKACRWFAPHC